MDAIDNTPQWRYPGGYQWLTNEGAIPAKPLDPRDRVLSTGLPAGAYSVVGYTPPANMFLTFAKTQCTEEGIRQFANSYGLLGLAGGTEGAVTIVLKSHSATSAGRMLEWADGSRSGALGTGELLSGWQR